MDQAIFEGIVRGGFSRKASSLDNYSADNTCTRKIVM